MESLLSIVENYEMYLLDLLRNFRGKEHIIFQPILLEFLKKSMIDFL